MPSSKEFLDNSDIAIFGISPKRRTFAGTVNDYLLKAGYKTYPVHPDGASGHFDSPERLPDVAQAAYIATGPDNTKSIVESLKDGRIKSIWFQNGSFNKEILGRCDGAGIKTYTGCLMMYIPEAGFIHRFHRAIHELFSGRQ